MVEELQAIRPMIGSHATGIPIRKLGAVFLLVVASLSSFCGCGVVSSYRNNVDKLDERLSQPMTPADVVKVLGEPTLVIEKKDRHVQVWEYRLYPRYHWAKELLACPFTAWLGGCLFYPAIGVSDLEYPPPYYDVLHNFKLSVWGTLETVSGSTTCYTPSKVSRKGHLGT
jgi:hypothetical protein